LKRLNMYSNEEITGQKLFMFFGSIKNIGIYKDCSFYFGNGI